MLHLLSYYLNSVPFLPDNSNASIENKYLMFSDKAVEQSQVKLHSILLIYNLLDSDNIVKF